MRAPDQATYTAGPLTFNVSNKDATAVNEIELLSGERIVGEKENLPPGFSGSFSLTLDPGDYTLYCPGATTEKTTLKVTGTGASTATDSDTHAAAAAGRDRSTAQYVNEPGRRPASRPSSRSTPR